MSALSLDLDDIVSQPGDFVILVAGDFNHLDTCFLESDYGLIQLVSTATHGDNILDKVFTNRPDLYNACVLKSLIKTKHAAVLVSNEPAKLCSTKRKTAELWDLRQHNIDRLRFAIGTFDWHYVLNSDNVRDMYDRFLDVITMLMQKCIPAKKVTLGIKDPPFITPLIKHLLNKRRKLRRQGRVDDANIVAERINNLISEVNKNSLSNLTDASPKELWRVVKDISGTTRLNSKFALLHPLLKDTDTVNAFFANISTNLNYNRDVVNAFSLHTEFNSILFNYEIEPILRRVKRTTRGFDGLDDCSMAF